jgi:uncharacterized protein YndB with AHSA1/START domain
MTRIAHTVELPFPVERVFRVATRVPDMPRWLPEVTGAELLDAELATGSRIRLHMGPGAANAVLTGSVKELHAPDRIVITGSGGPVGVTVRVLLTAVGEATTRASLEVDVATPPFLGFIAKEAERRITAELPASMERFGELVRAEPA